MRRFLSDFLIFVGVFFVVMLLISMGSFFQVIQGGDDYRLKEKSVLLLKLRGVIFNEDTFLENLRKYAKKDKIKGIIISVNSPGGVVGKSQEIYTEMKRIREEVQKPILAVCESVTASGAYYAILGASRIFTNPGTLMGSIGVVMQFANLENLYTWAKVKRYNLKTGAYKDSGSDHRPMTEAEKNLFQRLLKRVHSQFIMAIEDNRKSLLKDVLETYSDGRIFTGESAVKLGFADQIGTFGDALKLMGELTDLGEDIEVFEPPPKRKYLLENLIASSFLSSFFSEKFFKDIFSTTTSQKFLSQQQMIGKPLYLMPGILTF